MYTRSRTVCDEIDHSLDDPEYDDRDLESPFEFSDDFDWETRDFETDPDWR
jgi:hypothetical protein